jgi:outer membrane protein assembly factor BamB
MPRGLLPKCLLLSIGCAAPLASAADWPQWRGPARDGVGQESGLARQWPADGPRLLWQVDHVGVGYSSLAVVGDRIYTQGDLQGVEHVLCLDAGDGSIVWAVQPEPVAAALAQRVAAQFEQLDADADGTLDEAEALAGLGWNFNQSDAPLEGDLESIARDRAARLMAKLDADGDGRLTVAEAGGPFAGEFGNIDAEDPNLDGLELAAARADELLAAADKDADRAISRDESAGTYAQRRFDQIDERDPATNKGDDRLTADELATYFFKSEPGRDGHLNADELAAYYVRTLPGRDGRLDATELRQGVGGYRNPYGDGPRGTPTIDGDRVYVEGGRGDVACLDAATGATRWHVNLAADLGGGLPGWGYSESPLVEGDLLIVTPGGPQGALAALNKQTGEVVWRSAQATDSAHYSSPVAATIAGVRQIVQFTGQNLLGVAADDGGLLWTYNGVNNGTANVATPVVRDDQVFASSGYGAGGALVRVAPSGDAQTAEQVYLEKRMANHHGGVVCLGAELYGFGNNGLMCLDFASGEIRWSARSVSKGSLVAADGLLFCLGENHEAALVEASADEYLERGRFAIENLGRPSWAHPVVAHGRLYLRNQGRLAAYDVAAP